MNRPVRLIRSASWVALVSALLAPGGWAADPSVVITPAGVQSDSGETWHSGMTAKPLDVDGNDALGTDGYELVNLPPVRPAYLSVSEPMTGFYPGNELYAVMEDPAFVGSTFMTGTWDATPGGGARADLFRFTLNEAAVGRLIRVGLLIDNLDIASFNGAELSLVQTVGGSAQSSPVATTAGEFNNRNPDWVFFDVVGGQPGDTFVVRGLVGEFGNATLAGVVFDSLTATGGRLRSFDNRPSSPYPSRLLVSGVTAGASKMTLTLSGLAAGGQGLRMLLVGPGGQKIRPMDFAFGGFEPRNSATVTFDDAALAALPTLAEGYIPTGTYRPQGDQGFGDLPTPAPVGPYSSQLNSALSGPVNGIWSLYVSGTSASLNSWSLSFASFTVREPAAFGGGGISSGGIYSVSGTSGHFGTPTPMSGAEGLSLMGAVWALPILIHTPGAPLLEISLSSPGFVTLQWNSQNSGFVLQSTESLSQPKWNTTPTEGTNPVTLPVNSTSQAYRLFKP
jgi:hypothetical protein